MGDKKLIKCKHNIVLFNELNRGNNLRYYKLYKDSNLLYTTRTYSRALNRYDKEVETIDIDNNSKVKLKKYISNKNKRLKDLINYRLDNITEITIETYNVVQDMITLAKLYELDFEYINEIKNKFKEFKL